MTQLDARGALVISLDLEGAWGVPHALGASGYAANLCGERAAISALLEVFAGREIAATWATVGLMFARDREDAARFRPSTGSPDFDSTVELGAESRERGASAPLVFIPEVIAAIAEHPRQEIASHTFSHFCAREAAQSEAAFADDLRSARAIAEARGHQVESLVFPRNQVNYLGAVRAAGFSSYRGNPQRGPWGHPGAPVQTHRALRLVDSYANLTGNNLCSWDEILEPSGLANVRASAFLRAHANGRALLDGLKLARITRAMDEAAVTGRLFHLWWHPHNFGVQLEENLVFLGRVLDHFARLRDRGQLSSLHMSDVARLAKSRAQ